MADPDELRDPCKSSVYLDLAILIIFFVEINKCVYNVLGVYLLIYSSLLLCVLGIQLLLKLITAYFDSSQLTMPIFYCLILHFDEICHDIVIEL